MRLFPLVVIAVLALSLAPARSALPVERLLDAQGVRVSLRVIGDSTWPLTVGLLGAEREAESFVRASTVFARESSWWQALPHEFSHAYDHLRSGLADASLEPACLESPGRFGITPEDVRAARRGLKYWCARTEILARFRADVVETACPKSNWAVGIREDSECHVDYGPLTYERALAAILRD